jgi:hypothetical protein
MATAYAKQLAEWQEEDAKLFNLAFKEGFSGKVMQVKRGHRHQRFDRKNAQEVTIHKRVVRNNRKYDGLNRGAKGYNPVTAYK